jgi:hypothetical protein
MDYFEKLNEKRNNDAFIQKYIVAKLADKGITGKVDTYGNIKYESNGRLYRYHIKNRVVTKEIQTILSETQYSPSSKSWTRLKSFSYKDLTAVAEKYFSIKEVAV